MKIIVLGDAKVGKTDMLCTAAKVQKHIFYSETMGVDFKYINHHHVWDGAGSRSFNHLVEPYIKSCDAFIVAYSWEDPESMKSVRNYWIPLICKHVPIPNLSLVRCKIDIPCVCPHPELEDYFHQLGCNVYQTSSVTSRGIQELFAQYVDRKDTDNEDMDEKLIDDKKTPCCKCFPFL